MAKQRNIVVDESDVRSYGPVGLATEIDRGDIGDWHRILVALRSDHDGSFRIDLERALALTEMEMISTLFRDALDRDAPPERTHPEGSIPLSTSIRTLRARKGVSQRELAARLGVTRAAIQQYERNEASGGLSLAVFQRVLSELGATLTVQSADG